MRELVKSIAQVVYSWDIFHQLKDLEERGVFESKLKAVDVSVAQAVNTLFSPFTISHKFGHN